MLEHSSNSSRSNLFALSSESERSDPRRNKKHNYSSFVKKVKQLLEVEGDDLDDLYRKVEIIVKKYFNEHKIVEFGEMYSHLSALKSNSKKMAQIVSALEKKLISEHTAKTKAVLEGKHSDRLDDFEITSSTHKKTKKEAVKKSNAIVKKAEVEDSVGSVTSSIKYKYILKPSFGEGGADRSGRFQSYNQSSPSKSSPRRQNSSFEQYQKRNKQYQDKVKQLMREVTDIKNTIKSQPLEQQSFQLVDHGTTLKEALRIKLDESDFIKEESSRYAATSALKSQNQPMKESKQQKMSETNQSNTLSISKESVSVQIRPQSDMKPQPRPSIQQIEQKSVSLKGLTQVASNKSLASRPEQSKKSFVLQQVNAVTKHIEELKQYASLINQSSQKSPSEQPIPKPQSMTIVASSETKIFNVNPTSKPSINSESLLKKQEENNLPRDLDEQISNKESRESIDILGKTQGNQLAETIGDKLLARDTGSKEYLQKISNASSKLEITEEALPSFKYVEQKPKELQTSINVQESFLKGVESSVFSFSNTHYAPQTVQYWQKSSPQVQYPNNSSYIQASPSSQNTILHQARNTQQNFHVSNVKRGFKPYQQIEPQVINHHPQIRFIENNQPNRSVSITNTTKSAVLSPKTTSNLAILVNKSPIQSEKMPEIRISSKEKAFEERDRYSHLRSPQAQRWPAKPNVRFVNPSFTYQNSSGHSFNNSDSSFKRRGLNVLSPPYAP